MGGDIMRWFWRQAARVLVPRRADREEQWVGPEVPRLLPFPADRVRPRADDDAPPERVHGFPRLYRPFPEIDG